MESVPTDHSTDKKCTNGDWRHNSLDSFLLWVGTGIHWHWDALEVFGTGMHWQFRGIWRSILTHCPLLIHRGTHWHQCVCHRVRPVVTIRPAHIRVRCKVVSMWHQCSVGRSFIHVLWPQAHKLGAASYREMPFWRIDPHTNIAPC